jgi:hypothetical protein
MKMKEFRIPRYNVACMRKIALTVLMALFIASTLPCARGFCDGDDQWIARQKKLYLIKDHAGIDALLGEVNRRYPGFDERIRALALMRIDTPYRLGCLGEEKPPDKGPLFRLDEADCTVLVLTTTALAHGKTYRDARAMMKTLNYYNPPEVGDEVVNYRNRLHFTEERLHKCPCYNDITEELVPEKKLARVAITLNRKSDGSRLLDIPWERKVTVCYITSPGIDSSLMKKLPPVCGVAFIRKKYFAMGLAISHEGMILDGKWLVHADSRAGKVRKVNFLDYWSGNSDYFDGIVISKIL